MSLLTIYMSEETSGSIFPAFSNWLVRLFDVGLFVICKYFLSLSGMSCSLHNALWYINSKNDKSEIIYQSVIVPSGARFKKLFPNLWL